MRRTHTKVIGRTFAAAGVVAVAMTSGVDATTLLDIGFGTSLGGSTPRSTAMGSTGVALWQGSDALVFNPATMVSLEPGVHLDVALSMSQVNEDRLVPIFDSFQGFLDEGILAINRSTYASGQGGVVWRLPIGMPMSVGAGVFDRYDFDYDFFQEVRSEGAPDSLIRNNTLEVEGRLRSISAGYGAEIFRNARLGFSLHRYFGTVNGLRGVETPATTIPDTITTLEQELSGWGWSVGGHYRLNERVDFAASFDGPFDVDGATNSGTVISRSAGTTETTASGQRLCPTRRHCGSVRPTVPATSCARCSRWTSRSDTGKEPTKPTASWASRFRCATLGISDSAPSMSSTTRYPCASVSGTSKTTLTASRSARSSRWERRTTLRTRCSR